MSRRSRSPLRTAMRLCCLLVAILPGMAVANWCEDFETYTPGSFPSPNWTYTGNSAIVVDATAAYTGVQSLRVFGILGGCWGGVVVREIATFPVTVEMLVRNGTEVLTGCHPYRASLSINSGPQWTDGPLVSVFVFLSDGRFAADLAGQEVLATLALDQWYRVRVEFSHTSDGLLRAGYWIDGAYVGQATLPWQSWMDGLTHVHLGAQEGTVWFDDVCVSSMPTTQVVSVDIKPGSCPNPLNVKGLESTDEVIGTGVGQDAVFVEQVVASKAGPQSGGQNQAVVPVAILGTPGFDPRGIKLSTLRLEGVPAIRYGFEDVSTPMPDGASECACQTLGPDGLMDLTLKFNRAALIAALGAVHDGDQVPLTLTGEMEDGTPIEGSDCVLILGGAEVTSLAASVTAVPNPANPTTSFHIMSDHPSAFDMEIYNVQGQRVWATSGVAQTGRTVVHWDGRNSGGRQVATGVYFYQLRTDACQVQRKLLMLK